MTAILSLREGTEGPDEAIPQGASRDSQGMASLLGRLLRPLKGLAMTEAPRESGFTLVELLVVLAILGILASVSVASLPSLTSAARVTVADRISKTRRDAIASGRPVGLSLPNPATGGMRSWRFWPDGRAVGPGIDSRNGAVTDTALSMELTP